MSDGDTDPPEDRSDQKLTQKEAYNLTQNQGMKTTTVAKIYDVSPSYVSQQKKAYEEALETGKGMASPGDFEKDELESALEDKQSDDDEYECSQCGRSLDYMENDNCPNCDTPLGWSDL